MESRSDTGTVMSSTKMLELGLCFGVGYTILREGRSKLCSPEASPHESSVRQSSLQTCDESPTLTRS